MAINNWFDLTIYALFTIGMIIAIPIGLKYLYLASQKLILDGWSTKTFELLFSGLFIFLVGIWYLFFDNDGNISFLLKNANIFLTERDNYAISFKTILGVSVSIVFLSFISSIFFIKSSAVKRDELYIMHYNFMFKIFSYFIIIVAILVFILFLKEVRSINILISLFIGLMIFSIGIFLQFNFTKVKYNDINIYLYSPWRKNRIIQWSKIESYIVLENYHIYRITMKNGDNINIPVSLSGLGSFFERLHREELLKKPKSG